MPVMDGYTATKEVRKLDEESEIPIIALTAHQDKKVLNKCIDNGCSTYESKPRQKKELIKLIHHYLEKSNNTPNSFKS